MHHFRDLSEVRYRHSGHWFDADTMRFFRCRLPAWDSPLIGGRYFVTSEQNAGPYTPTYPRLYTIREAMSNGDVQTIGEFQGYETRRAAERAARDLPTDYSASLMAVLESGELHNRNGWIKTSKQLARYTGAPLEDAQATIRARARLRRRARRSEAVS